ncbi:hypothetical protein HMPREF3023_06360 [Peptoniphilus sp. HMSC075B08]|uniref:hypothetical protein n=1 Tax=Peptoniphilus sp. HMSC075B08 TaxID=1739525 RepID=UPI0008A3FCF5|nr:hypothetical protein [Peptoniphilus sp. HMSC075B08]OFO63162.1 hypothetical protein HMPREF3023_06360 [Peptoniphilus sp. HMSC075B08]
MKKILIVLSFCCLFLFGCSNANSFFNKPTLSEEDIEYIKNEYSNFTVEYNVKENKISLYSANQETTNLLNYYLNNGLAGALKFNPDFYATPYFFGYSVFYKSSPKALTKTKELAYKGLNDPEARRSFIAKMVRYYHYNLNEDYQARVDLVKQLGISEDDAITLLEYFATGKSPYIGYFDSFVKSLLTVSQRFTDKYNKDLTIEAILEGTKVAEVSGNYVTYNKLDEYRDQYNFDFNEVFDFAYNRNIPFKDDEFELDNIDFNKKEEDSQFMEAYKNNLIYGDNSNKKELGEALYERYADADKDEEYLDNPNSAKPDEFEANDGEPMEYVPSEEELEEMERIDEYNSSQESPYVKGQELIVTGEKANIRKEPYLEGKVVGYWIKDDVVTVYDYIFYEERWWIKTDPNKEWWVSERDLKSLD